MRESVGRGGLAITVGIARLPTPGITQHEVEPSPGLPAEFASGFVRVGPEGGEIAGAPGREPVGDGHVGDPRKGVDQLKHAVALPRAQIIGMAAGGLQGR